MKTIFIHSFNGTEFNEYMGICISQYLLIFFLIQALKHIPRLNTMYIENLEDKIFIYIFRNTQNECEIYRGLPVLVACRECYGLSPAIPIIILQLITKKEQAKMYFLIQSKVFKN